MQKHCISKCIDNIEDNHTKCGNYISSIPLSLCESAHLQSINGENSIKPSFLCGVIIYAKNGPQLKFLSGPTWHLF